MISKKWRRRWEAVGEKITFLVAPFVLLLIKITPLSLVYHLGSFLARLVGVFAGRRKKIALANLHLVFGKQKGEKELKAIYRKCLVLTVVGFIELIKLASLPYDVAKGRIEVVGKDHLDAALAKGKGVIITGLHLGNFPLLAALLAIEGYPIAVIIKRPRNRYIGRLYERMTAKIGIKFIDGKMRREAAMNSLRQLRSGGIVYIVIDQNPPYPDIMVEFFGYEVPSYKGPVVLAMRTGAVILPAFIVYRDGWLHRLIIEPPFHLQVTEDKEKDVAQNLARLIKTTEKYIEQYPEQWWWWHRRWKRHIDYKHL